MPLRLCFVCFASLMLASGCATRERKYLVTGTVTWDGAPLADGIIVFRAADNSTGDHDAVEDGTFKFEATAGKKIVSITANREVKLEDIKDPKKREAQRKMREAMGGAVPQEQFLPDRYNVKSRLEAEVIPGGTNQFEFKLTSKP